MMSDKKYLFNGKDISINVYVQIRTVVNVIMERTQKTFMEAVEIFYDSEHISNYNIQRMDFGQNRQIILQTNFSEKE